MKPRKVLIVEDDAIIAMYIQHRLENMGYQVVAKASTGKEAIIYTNKYAPELIIMDVMLEGEMDGIEAVAQILKKFDIPVIYLTASSDEHTITRLMDTQPNGFIIKPFDDKILRSALQIAIYRHQAKKELFEMKELLRTTLDSIDDLVFSLNMDGVFTHNHSKSKELITRLGWSKIEGKTIEDVFEKKISDNFIQAIKNIHLTGTSELLSIQLDGEEAFYFNAKLSRRKDLGNKTLGLTLVLSEVADASAFHHDNHQEEVIDDLSPSGKTMPGLNLSILVVEDMSINQKVLRLLLEEMDCHVSVAGNGKEALDLFRETTINAFGIFGNINYDIILMDQVMPIMDGSNAVQNLKESYQNLPPVIALTADESFLSENKYQEYGFDDCLIKPVTPAELYAKLSYWKSMNIKTILKHHDVTPILNEIENKPVINKNTLGTIHKIIKNNDFNPTNLLETFSQDMEMIQERFITAVENNDYDQLKRIILTIKGLSGNMGASQLHATAKLLETYLMDERYDDFKNLYPLLHKKYSIFKNRIEKEFKSISEKKV
jgi:CheY-like chemotaxis protein